MKSHFFAYISRMRFIQRWALMRNTAPENVQEHSHQVAVLAHALAVIRNEKFGGQVDPGAVAAAALYHDATEIFTGDLPTPVKYANDTIQAMADYTVTEAQIENLVVAKGYTDCVAFIGDESVSLAVAAPEGGITEADTARIVDIVTEVAGFTASQIKIIEVE